MIVVLSPGRRPSLWSFPAVKLFDVVTGILAIFLCTGIAIPPEEERVNLQAWGARHVVRVSVPAGDITTLGVLRVTYVTHTDILT